MNEFAKLCCTNALHQGGKVFKLDSIIFSVKVHNTKEKSYLISLDVKHTTKEINFINQGNTEKKNLQYLLFMIIPNIIC